MKQVLVLLAIAAVIAVGAGAARAQVTTNETVSYPFSGYVSCANGGAGELVNGVIDVHNLITSTSNGNTDASQLMFQAHGTLVGSITGDVYRLADVTKVTDNAHLNGGVLTYVSRYRLIGPGPGNNLRVSETAHITRIGDDIVVQHDNWTIDCA
jgi:hypothetical protein